MDFIYIFALGVLVLIILGEWIIRWQDKDEPLE